jgi:hypothetical protein
LGRLIQFRPENGTNVTATRFTVLFNKEPIGVVKPDALGILFFDGSIKLSLSDLAWVVQKSLNFFKVSSSQVN